MRKKRASGICPPRQFQNDEISLGAARGELRVARTCHRERANDLASLSRRFLGKPRQEWLVRSFASLRMTVWKYARHDFKNFCNAHLHLPKVALRSTR